MSALRSRVEISNDRRPHFMVLRALPEAKVTVTPGFASLTAAGGHLAAEGPRAGWEACELEQPGWLCYARGNPCTSAQHFQSVSAFFGAAPSASLSK